MHCHYNQSLFRRQSLDRIEAHKPLQLLRWKSGRLAIPQCALLPDERLQIPHPAAIAKFLGEHPSSVKSKSILKADICA